MWLHYINYTSLIRSVRLFLNKWDLFIQNVISVIYIQSFIHVTSATREQCGLSNKTLNAPNSNFMNVVTFIFSEDLLF